MDSKIVYKNANDRPLKLSDLMWEILLGWRLLLVFAVVFAVAFGGLKYVRDMRTPEQSENATVDIKELETQLTEDERAQIFAAKSLRMQISNQERYQCESIRINLDAYAKNTVVLQYYVDTNYSFNLNEDISLDYVNDIIAAYVSYIENNGINEELGKQLEWDIDERYIGELVSAEANVIKVGDNEADARVKMFQVRITGESADKAEELADVISELLAQYQPGLNEKIGQHELTMVDRYSSVSIDRELSTEQEEFAVSMKTLRTNLDSMVEKFSANQLSVWNLELGAAEEVEEADGSAAVNEETLSAFSIKYVLIGAFGGVFLGCIWIVICCLWSSRIRNMEELQQMYGVRGLGSLSETVKRKRVLEGVDRWLLSLKDKERWTADERKNLILTNIRVICKKEGVERVFLTSSVHMAEESRRTIDQLIDELQKFGIKAEYGDCIASNAASVERMAEIGQIIFIEEAGVSRYESIEKEIGVCCEQNINILGAIVM